MLEQNRYACFSEPTHSIAGDPPEDIIGQLNAHWLLEDYLNVIHRDSTTTATD
jgi:hypothetical protein